MASNPVSPAVDTVWTESAIDALFDLPFSDLLYRAQQVHRRHFEPNTVQLSTLLNIKSGGCPEDCAYCPQSVRYTTHVQAEQLMDTEAVVEAARRAREAGASRFCMGAAWRSPKDRDLVQVADMIAQVKSLGLETCATLGMLSAEQATRLHEAGLDYYNHNLDTSERHYQAVISTRGYDDRLQTLARVREAGIKVCCGGILGMGETRQDRSALLATLAGLPAPPESVPINVLVPVPGTPLAEAEAVDPLDVVRTIAVARVVLPRSMLRLSAGRSGMSEELQALCFLAGANSVFYGEELLTTGNPSTERDRALFRRLGIRAQA